MQTDTPKTTICAAGLVTKQYDFMPTNGPSENLFSVRGGVPLSDAFNQLSVLMSSTMGALNQLALDDDTDGIPAALWQSIHVMEFTFALVQSMHQGIPPHDRTGVQA